MRLAPQLLATALVVVLLLGSLSFAIDATGGPARPVPFEGTNEGGLGAGAVYDARRTDAAIPRAEAFYAQYPYAVGYYGIPFLIADLHRATRSEEFGRLLTVYVSDFADTAVRLDDESVLTVPTGRYVGWVAASEAYFVVDSRARTPGNTSAVVPFSEQRAARAFAAQYNGSVVRWATLRTRRFEGLERTRAEWQRVVAHRRRWANRTVARARSLRERSASVVVGRDAPTLSAAVAAAPPNTTVRVPPGTYAVGELRIGKPITIRGAGPNRTVVGGDGRGSVFDVTADRVAITGLRIDGVGSRSEAGSPLVPRTHRYYGIREAYGRGAAGIVFTGAAGSLVANVTVETPTHGLLVRSSPGTAVTNTTVYAPPRTNDTSIGISVMASRIVVQDSALYGGFHSFIVHNTSGIVVRNVHAEGAVTGFHGLYTRSALLADSTFRDAFKPVMTATEGAGNAAIGNDVRNSVLGVDFAGSRSYVGGNTIAHNRIGMLVEGRGTLYTDNVIGYNGVGVQVANPFPTNRITNNDLLGNERPVRANNRNVLFVWTEDGRGNYWAGFDRLDRDGDGIVERSIRPTSPVGRLSYRAPGGTSLARSAAVTFLRALQTVVRGLRPGGVVDTAPLAAPRSPRRVAALEATYSMAGPYRPAHDPDPYDYHAPRDIPHVANDTFG